jgi:hypothetical protein
MTFVAIGVTLACFGVIGAFLLPRILEFWEERNQWVDGMPLNEVIAKTKVRRARAKYIAEVTQSSTWKTDYGFAVIARDPRKPDFWRLTYLQDDGVPTGHLEARSYEDALWWLGKALDTGPVDALPRHS